MWIWGIPRQIDQAARMAYTNFRYFWKKFLVVMVEIVDLALYRFFWNLHHKLLD